MERVGFIALVTANVALRVTYLVIEREIHHRFCITTNTD